jgi:SAM-dependent methyltransferase/uncharacterized protein YbaR (Trm112 family)
MYAATLEKVRCPKRGCQAPLRLLQEKSLQKKGQAALTPEKEIRSGQLECQKCRKLYPIFEGVALLVPNPREYTLMHVKGISQVVPDSQIPRDWWDDYQEARAELEEEHIEEDLESKRVTSLYIMNHYLRASPDQPWWRSRAGQFSPEIEELILRFWNRGPFSKIAELLTQGHLGQAPEVLELGCGVGGLSVLLRPSIRRYLGVDSSFASIAIARHLALGMDYAPELLFPEDLLQGSVSRKLSLNRTNPSEADGLIDFVVGDLENAPLGDEAFDISIALNAIDMLENPQSLPLLQARAVRPEGLAIQSCPYIWHERIARKLRGQVKKIQDSAEAVEWLYQQKGFQIQNSHRQIPWLFFKHIRQLELYSVHLFLAQKQRNS